MKCELIQTPIQTIFNSGRDLTEIRISHDEIVFMLRDFKQPNYHHEGVYAWYAKIRYHNELGQPTAVGITIRSNVAGDSNHVIVEKGNEQAVFMLLRSMVQQLELIAIAN